MSTPVKVWEYSVKDEKELQKRMVDAFVKIGITRITNEAGRPLALGIRRENCSIAFIAPDGSKVYIHPAGAFDLSVRSPGMFRVSCLLKKGFDEYLMYVREDEEVAVANIEDRMIIIVGKNAIGDVIELVKIEYPDVVIRGTM